MASKKQMYLYCCLGFYLELFLFGWLFFLKMKLEIEVCRSCDLAITIYVVIISVTLRKVFLGLIFLCGDRKTLISSSNGFFCFV